MEHWEQELDEYLAPFGVIFSEERTMQRFKQDMRTMLNHIQIPLLSRVVLYDGMGSLVLRIMSLAALLAIYIQYPYKSDPLLFICLALVSLPGLWIWSYHLMPQEKRMKRMCMLFDKKIKEGQKYPPSY